MAATIDHPAHRSNVRGDTSGGFIMGDKHSLDGTYLVVSQNAGVILQWHPGTPGYINGDDIQPQPLRHFDPKRGKLPIARHQHGITGVQRIGHCRFPSTRARSGKQQHLATGGAQNLFHVAKQPQRQITEIRGPHVLHRHIHRLAHHIGHIGRAGNEQMGNSGFHACSIVKGMDCRCQHLPPVQSESGFCCKCESLQNYINVIL